MFYLYLLKSLKDNKQYLGITSNYVKRLKQHNNGSVRSTKVRIPFILLGYQTFENRKTAAIFEKKYKRSHGSLERAIKKGEFIIAKDM